LKCSFDVKNSEGPIRVPFELSTLVEYSTATPTFSLHISQDFSISLLEERGIGYRRIMLDKSLFYQKLTLVYRVKKQTLAQ